MPEPSAGGAATGSLEPPRRGALPWPGLLSALAFGLATPAMRVVFRDVSSAFAGGWLYLASGIGLSAVLVARRRPGGRRFERSDLPWLVGAIASGGVLAPYAYARGVAETSALLASLLLNLEVVFTAVLAATFFGERLRGPRRLGIGLVALGGAACAAATAGNASGGGALSGCLWTALACLAWALDNNLTSRIAAKDSLSIARWKGLVGGGATLAVAGALGLWPEGAGPRVWLGGGLVGVVGFGLSLALFIESLRAIGAVRTSAVFATAPFLGAVASAVVLGERLSPWLAAAGALMAAGVLLATREPKAAEGAPRPE